MNNFIIKYGVDTNYFDVTEIVYNKFVTENIIHIPSGEKARSFYFSDPLRGVLKKVFITDKNSEITCAYEHSDDVFIDTIHNIIYVKDVPEYIEKIFSKIDKYASVKLKTIHEKTKIEFGSFSQEFPEQMMAAKYLTGNEKVLEIGGNIGRNSLVIASLLKDQRNLVVLESDTDTSKELIHNRDINNMHFFVENSALSKRKLIQISWETFASDILLDGHTEVNIISWQELNTKYNIAFDTLILDCEGAFYYILMDMPEILTNIKTIIMENDYHNIDHKIYVDSILKQNNFVVDYTEGNGWGACTHYFYEVWVKKE
jgi:FkbM family methyltransferase